MEFSSLRNAIGIDTIFLRDAFDEFVERGDVPPLIRRALRRDDEEGKLFTGSEQARQALAFYGGDVRTAFADAVKKHDERPLRSALLFVAFRQIEQVVKRKRDGKRELFRGLARLWIGGRRRGGERHGTEESENGENE